MGVSGRELIGAQGGQMNTPILPFKKGPGRETSESHDEVIVQRLSERFEVPS